MFKFNKRVRVLGWQNHEYLITISQQSILYRFTGGKRVRNRF